MWFCLSTAIARDGFSVVALAVSGSPNHTSFFPSPIFTLSPFSSRLKLRLLSFLFRISYLGLPPFSLPAFHLPPLSSPTSTLPPTTAAPSSVIQLFVECCSRQSKAGNQLEPYTLLGGSWDLVSKVISTLIWGYKYSYPNYNPSY